MKKKNYLYGLIGAILLLSPSLQAASWNSETTDWSQNTQPKIGDWGMNRPGYPAGLYIHGITVKAGKWIKNPVIYDNDVYDDVFDDEWMFCMASLGKMNLVGQIITPVLTDFWTFYHPDWVQTGLDAYECGKKSGLNMKRIPPITIGTEAKSEKEGERKESAGAYLYVDLINKQYNKNPNEPLIINIGGQAATLASAFCIDPSIAEKCIVYYTDLKVYNGHYQWASELVAQNFRVINWGDDEHWWHRKACQNEWNVLPRPQYCKAQDNSKTSGEWAKLTDMNIPMLDRIIDQFLNRSEYCNDQLKGDAYADGTFIHAWLPGIFSAARLETVRGGEVLQVAGFTEENERLVKDFTLKTLLNPKAYQY